MDVENAANMLAGSILIMLALTIVVIGVVAINNIFSRFWKPVQWIKYDDLPPRFVTREELADHKETQEPKMTN